MRKQLPLPSLPILMPSPHSCTAPPSSPVHRKSKSIVIPICPWVLALTCASSCVWGGLCWGQDRLSKESWPRCSAGWHKGCWFVPVCALLGEAGNTPGSVSRHGTCSSDATAQLGSLAPPQGDLLGDAFQGLDFNGSCRYSAGLKTRQIT